jgi:hypothetical protein
MNSKEYSTILNIPLHEKEDSQILRGGILMLIITVIINLLNIKFEILIVLQFIISVFSALWAVHRAEILNRNKIYWGVLAFLFPPIVLTILGFLKTNIKISSINNLVTEYRKKYEFKTQDIDFPQKEKFALKSKIYNELSSQLKQDISIELKKLNIQPDKINTASPSSFTVGVGGLIASLFLKNSATQKSTINKAKLGYIFNVIVLLLLISVLIYIIIHG